MDASIWMSTYMSVRIKSSVPDKKCHKLPSVGVYFVVEIIIIFV